MSTLVRIPTALRTLTSGASQVWVEGTTIGEVIDALDASYPGVRSRVVNEDGTLHRFVNLFVGDEDIRFQQGIHTRVPEGETVSIIPAVAGG